MKFLLVPLCAGLLFSAAPAQDKTEENLAKLPPIMRKFVLARHNTRYTGTRFVEFKKGPDRFSHTEYVWKDGIRSRTEFPDDSDYRGQIIVDDGKQRMHFYPDRNEIEVEPAHRRQDSRSFFRDSITQAVSDGGQVAGYATQLVTVADKNGNTLEQMWIEPKTGVRLKLIIFDKVGTRADSYEFSKINFKPTFTAGDFTMDRRGATIVTPTIQAKRLAQKYGLTPVVIERGSGYELQSARIMHPEHKDVLVQNFVGESGRFSFFQLKGDLDQHRLSRFARGRLSTYAWKQNGESFAVIGNLSQDQLKQIAKFLGDR